MVIAGKLLKTEALGLAMFALTAELEKSWRVGDSLCTGAGEKELRDARLNNMSVFK